MITTRAYDTLNRLTNIVSLTNSAPFTSFSYGYNAASQRTNANTVDNSHWVYQYDKLGQVTSGWKYWSNGTPVVRQQFAGGGVGNCFLKVTKRNPIC